MKPGLYGLHNSNRNFATVDSWGKNQFNSAFPASLLCYMAHNDLNPNFIEWRNGVKVISEPSGDQPFGFSLKNRDLYFAFESQYKPFRKFTDDELPRTDLVIRENSEDGSDIAALEIKLTALPDSTTCDLSQSEYGCELVVRPDSIVYLAASLSAGDLSIGKNLNQNVKFQSLDWTNTKNVLISFDELIQDLETALIDSEESQKPFLLQPVWKTKGKSPELHDDCLDVFIWSDLAFTRFLISLVNVERSRTKVNRSSRTLIWLHRMLCDIGKTGSTEHRKIIDELTYGTKNDKAFAASGIVTSPWMTCGNLSKPRVSRNKIAEIILGGGQKLLSPERRFDAVIYNTPDLFS